jgi:ribose-phosphate pyrophosphokinase
MEESYLFAFDDYADMASCLISGSNPSAGRFQIKRFANGEQHIHLDVNVSGQPCFVLGSIAPPDSCMFSFLLLCHTLKKEGASSLTVILPYLAYSRHDKNEMQKSYATAFVAEFFACVGINNIVTFDIHSQTASQLFSMPLVSLSPASVFVEKLKTMNLQNLVLVAPDEGAIERCQDLASAAGIGGNIVYMVKKRTEEGILHTELHGTVKEHAIIIDDMLDTGGTLVSCCQSLLDAGVKSIDIMVTHGLFTGENWMQLWALGVRKIYCTNTIPPANGKRHPNIEVLSIIPSLKETLQFY